MKSEVKEKMEDLEYIRDVFTHLEDAEGVSFNYYIGIIDEEINHQLLNNSDYSVKFLKKNGNQFSVYNDKGIFSYRDLIDHKKPYIVVSQVSGPMNLNINHLNLNLNDQEKIIHINGLVDKFINQIRDKIDFSRVENNNFVNIHIRFYY